jgi:diguanylate cyclase (GGDEF)-like protein
MHRDNNDNQGLLGLLAHDLRNGLAPLRLAWEVVRRAGDDPVKRQHAGGILDRQLARMVRLVDDAEDISSIAEGSLTLQSQCVDVRCTLSEVANDAASIARAYDVGLRVTLPDEPVLADADPARLLQALSRLFLHAIQSTAASCEVDVWAGMDNNGGLVMRLRHPSRGPPDQLGIELIVSLRLIELHGGTLEARGAADPPASEFIVRLPAAQRPALAALATAPLQGPPASTPATGLAQQLTALPAAEGGRPLVMLVDDNSEIREYVGSLLAVHWEVAVYADGASALDAARARPPDLVLTDIVMPGLDGFGLLRALRQDSTTRVVPVIMLSARSAEEARVQGLDAGADDYLVKPFGSQELLARVRTHLDIARLRREAVEAAKHDPLTGLANRSQGYAFADAIFARARRGGTQAAVLVIDLDRFKPINDTYGHDVGDSVLQEVARRLKASLRGEDVVARLGGDEFLAVLAGIRNGSDAANACRHILASLELPVRVRDLQLRISPSIGISIFPDDGIDVSVLAKNADMAMYHAKQSGRNTFHFFTAELDRRAARIQRIEARLRHSLDQQEFELNYQPIVNLSTRRVEAVEALLRWPAAGIGPEEFIPIAEMSGVIERLGEWAMRECCAQVRRWQHAGLPRMTLSINVSPLQFRQPGLLSTITQAVEMHQLDPADIQLELTETALLHDEADAIAHMRAIKDYGLKLALDDFGRGFSSLHYIGRLPLDTIKVDQSFVRNLAVDLASAAVTDAVIAIGRSLGLSVVAEGIESAQVLRKLQERDCHRVQGNFICPPVSADELVGWYRQWTAQ